jgi:hypothetical protein
MYERQKTDDRAYETANQHDLFHDVA